MIQTLKADVSDAGEGWSDSKIIEALDSGESMVYRGAQATGTLVLLREKSFRGAA